MVPLLHPLVLVPPLLLVLMLHMLNCKVMVDHLGMLLVSPDWGRSGLLGAAAAWLVRRRRPIPSQQTRSLDASHFYTVFCARNSLLRCSLCGLRFCRKWWHGGGCRRRWAHGRLSSSLKQSARICCMSAFAKA